LKSTKKRFRNRNEATRQVVILSHFTADPSGVAVAFLDWAVLPAAEYVRCLALALAFVKATRVFSFEVFPA
jgi:hypothetical protein